MSANISQRNANAGGIEEAKGYMTDKEIPQLFESMMTALMYKKPTDHLEFLQTCLDKAKDQRKVHWHSFIDPLPPIPKAGAGPIASEKAPTPAPLTPRPPSAPKKPATPTLAKAESPLPPIAPAATEATLEAEGENQANQVIENVTTAPDEAPAEAVWYADYVTKKIDTSCLVGKPVLFVLGGPGSGKGTQCAKIVDKYGYCHLSAGDLLRAEVEGGTGIGTKLDAIMKEGQLVPQAVTICLLKEALVANASSKGFLIDGFPRETNQGLQFEKEVCLARHILYYTCPDETLVERLLARAVHSGRIDDNEETIKKRLALFHSKTTPVITYYSKITTEIDATPDVETVFKKTCNVINGVMQLHDSESEFVTELTAPEPVAESTPAAPEPVEETIPEPVEESIPEPAADNAAATDDAVTETADETAAEALGDALAETMADTAVSEAVAPIDDAAVTAVAVEEEAIEAVEEVATGGGEGNPDIISEVVENAE